MSATRLILIEGMIGSGKTTTARWVEDWLSRREEDARAFCEFAEDHPIRTRAVDELRAAGLPACRPPGPAEAGTTDEPDVYAPSQWRQLAERCLRGRQTVILESSFLQNSVMPAFIDGATADEVTRLFTRILRQAAPAEPFLVYLRPADIAAAIARVHHTRGRPWAAQNAAFVADSPLGAPPRPARAGRGGRAIPGMGGHRELVVRPIPLPQAHADRPATRLASRAGKDQRSHPPVIGTTQVAAGVRLWPWQVNARPAGRPR